MTRAALSQVTLCAVDTRCPDLAAQSLQRSMAQAQFARVLLFTTAWAPARELPGIDIIDIGPIRSGADYSHFVLRRLPAFITSPHVLITQWDGFVLDGSAWRDEFLQWDYIGAPWDEGPAAQRVGNGGFSLRSQRLLQAGLDERLVDLHPEDETLCRRHRDLLEREHGVRFAPVALARQFAFENEAPAGASFGFHGPRNLARVLDESTLIAWLAALPDDFFRGRDARRLARALLARRMTAAAQALLRRRRAAGRQEPATRLLDWWATAQSAIAQAGR